MAEVKKARLFLRRGTDTDRKTTTLCEGELGYSTDAFRVVIGDGSIAGGRSTGGILHVSAGTLATNFQTNLTEASAFPGRGGFALSGDMAIFANSSYTNAVGDSVDPIGGGNVGAPVNATVMVLTGSNAAVDTSWVAVNSGIPWGNLSVQDDDISGNKIHGGTISGPISLSSGQVSIGGNSPSETLQLSGVALSADNATPFLGQAAKIYPLGITGTAQVTALSSVFDFSNSEIAGYGPTFIPTVSLSADNNSATTGEWDVVTTLNLTTLATNIPPQARTVILSIMAERYGRVGTQANDTRAILNVTNDPAGNSANLIEAFSLKVAKNEFFAGTAQVFCPIHNDSGVLKIYIKANQKFSQLGQSNNGQWTIKAVGYQK